MAASESKARLKGLFNIAVTPFLEGGDIDFAGLSRNIERVLALGYDGILIGGTYGEFPSMTTDERATLFRKAMSVVGDRAPVMLCAASSDVRVARELTALASDLGGVSMITPPFVSEVTDEQIFGFFKDIAPRSRTGVVIYNAPGVGITLGAELLERLANVEGVVGLKQGDLSASVVDRLANRLGGRLRLFCASDLAFLGPMACGFDGVSSTNSCAFPELILSSYRAMERGDAHTATRTHRLWYDYRAAARLFGQPQTVKGAMKLRGFAAGGVRAPLTDLSAAQYEEISTIVRQLALESESGIRLHH